MLLTTPSSSIGLHQLTTAVYESPSALPLKYERFLDRYNQGWFYLTSAWFNNFTSTALDPDDLVRWYIVELQDSPVLALPTRRRCRRLPFQARELQGLSNFYTSLFAPIVNTSADSAQSALNVLATAVATDRYDVVDLKPLDATSALFAQTLSAFREAGFLVQPYFCFGNWYADVDRLSYQDYFKTLPSVLRNTIVRKQKKLNANPAAHVQLFTSAEGIEAAIAAYEKVYLSSWKVPEPYPQFTAGFIRTCAANGWLRLGVVYVDNQPIAAQLWVVAAQRATIFKLAHDEQFASYSAGSILTARLMQHVVDIDHVREVDFGSGDDDYKRSWLPHRRERWGLACFNRRSLTGLALSARHIGGRAAKNFAKRLRP